MITLLPAGSLYLSLVSGWYADRGGPFIWAHIEGGHRGPFKSPLNLVSAACERPVVESVTLIMLTLHIPTSPGHLTLMHSNRLELSYINGPS